MSRGKYQRLRIHPEQVGQISHFLYGIGTAKDDDGMSARFDLLAQQFDEVGRHAHRIMTAGLMTPVHQAHRFRQFGPDPRLDRLRRNRLLRGDDAVGQPHGDLAAGNDKRNILICHSQYPSSSPTRTT